MRRTSIAVGAILAAGVAATSEVHAQQWLQDRGLTEGRGIRAGNFEFHPGVGAEFGYDSNAFALQDPPTPALRLRLTPSIAFSTLGPQRSTNTTPGTEVSALPTANFRAHAALTYHHFFSIGGPADVSRLSNLGATTGFRLELFPQRTWQFNLSEDFSRIVQGGPEGGLSLALYNRLQNRASAELVFAPNSGIVDARVGYANQVIIFERPEVSFYNFMSHEIALRNRWRFLPKTAFLWEGIFNPVVFLNPGGSSTGLFTGYPIRSRIGVNGLLTERFGLLLMVGYQATYFERGDNTETVIGQAEGRWIIGPTSSVRLGAQRDVLPSFLGNFFVRNRAYLNYGQSFAGRFLVTTELSAGILEYGFIADLSGNRHTSVYGGSGVGSDGRFNTVRLQGILFGEYRASEIVGINATAQLSSNLLPFGDVNIQTGTLPASIGFTKLELYVGARVNW